MKPLYGMSGKAYQLDSSPIGSGGEGNIYRLINDNGQVAKIYHSSNRSLEIEQKLIFMVKKPPSSRVMSQVAWPLDILYDSQQKFCGFIMPKLSITDELQVLYQYPPQKYKNLTTKQKIIVAENICAVISDIHKAGYVFGDFNPRNIGIDIKTGRVAFLDTDTYHIVLDKSNNKAYRCIVCLDGYVAPELLTKIDMEKINKDAYALASLDTFTKETDYFALAIHLFKLLMNGYTPFNGIKEVDSASQASPGVGNVAIRRDNYCFKPGNKPQSSAVPPIDTLPKEIAELFTRAFIYGRRDPKQRPSALEWYGALVKYENSLKNCAQNPAHQYYKTLAACPWCEADTRYNNATAPSLSQKSYGAPPVVTPPVVLVPPSPVTSPLQNLQPQSAPKSYSANPSSTHKVGLNSSSNSQPVIKGSTIVGTIIIAFILFMLIKSADTGNNSNTSKSIYSEQVTTSVANDNNGSDNTNNNLESNTDSNVSNSNTIISSSSNSERVDKTTAVQTITGKEFNGRIQSEEQVDEFIYVAPITGTYRFNFQVSNPESYFRFSMALEQNSGIGVGGELSYEGGENVELKAGTFYKIKIKQKLGLTDYKVVIDIPTECQTITSNAFNGDIHFVGQIDEYIYIAPVTGEYRFEFLSDNVQSYFDFSMVYEPPQGISVAHELSSEGGKNVGLKAGTCYKIKIKHKTGFLKYHINISLP